MSGCCGPKEEETNHCHPESKSKIDFWFWGPFLIVATAYLSHALNLPLKDYLGEKVDHFAHHNFELMNKMWWGILLGALAVGILQYIPQTKIQKIMDSKSRVGGILRATAAGVLLDLCSHGILMVGLKLYKKGLSLGQTMAFLIASPWNSFSLTIILGALIGWKWTLLFILFSLVVAIISGLIFDFLVDKKILPENPAQLAEEDAENTKGFLEAFPKSVSGVFKDVIWFGLKDSKSIIKWLFIGVILASLLREFLSPEQFQSYFGPDGKGLFFTLILATVLEVCSEGSAPIASDILVKAKAPGNAFGFLMTGVSTDYTEIMAIKEKMNSWKIALFLPLVTLPQVIFIAWLININT